MKYAGMRAKVFYRIQWEHKRQNDASSPASADLQSVLILFDMRRGLQNRASLGII